MLLSNPWAALPLVAGIACLAAGLGVLLRHPRTPAHLLFTLFSTVAAAGNGAFALSLASPDEAGFVEWNKRGWLLYLAALAVFCHFTLRFPRPRRPLAEASHPLVGRLPAPLLRIDRALLGAPGASLLACYLPILGAILLAALPADSWFQEPRRVFYGYVAVARPTPASLPALGATVITVGFLGANLLGAYLQFPEKRRVLALLRWWFLAGFVLLVLLFILPWVSLEWYARSVLLNYLGIPAFALFLATVVLKSRFFVTPVDEARGPGEPRFDLMRGATYLAAEERPDLCHRAFADLVTHGTQGLCLTRTPPLRIRETHGLEKTPVVWVGEQSPSAGVPSVHGPDELAYIAAKFLSESREGVVALDCLEYLVQTADFRRALKLVYHLKEMVARKGGRLLLSVNPRSLEPWEWSLLEKETEPLPEERPRHT
ncbi:MAG: DUF835 domain-containing protein [Halobacteria archaeon]